MLVFRGAKIQIYGSLAVEVCKCAQPSKIVLRPAGDSRICRTHLGERRPILALDSARRHSIFNLGMLDWPQLPL